MPHFLNTMILTVGVGKLAANSRSIEIRRVRIWPSDLRVSLCQSISSPSQLAFVCSAIKTMAWLLASGTTLVDSSIAFFQFHLITFLILGRNVKTLIYRSLKGQQEYANEGSRVKQRNAKGEAADCQLVLHVCRMQNTNEEV